MYQILFCSLRLKSGNIYRNFRLFLTPRRGVLHPKFEATVVDGEGNEKPVAVSK